MFANANTLIYNTSKLGAASIGSSLIPAAIMRTQRADGQNMEVGCRVLYRKTLISSLVTQH